MLPFSLTIDHSSAILVSLGNEMTLSIMDQLRARAAIPKPAVVVPWGGTWLATQAGTPTSTKFTPPDDLLTLSVTHHRLRNSPPTPATAFFEDGIIDPKLVPFITPEDREKAVLIRDHYSKKIMVLVLKGIPFTPYRQKLNGFINSSVDLEDDIIPLVFKLPEFYEYDIGYEEVRTTLTQPEDGILSGPVEVTLTPMKHFRVKKKAGGHDEYWLKDEAGCGYQIKLPNTPVVNPLLHLWNREFTKPNLRISGVRKLHSPDGFKFYVMDKWEVA